MCSMATKDEEEEDCAIELPEVWKDDQRMDVLFSPFRDNREINPNSWDTKHKFWSKMITQLCRESKTLIFDPKSLHQKFKRKGKTPVCLVQVLSEMHRNGNITSIDSYEKSLSAGWLSWGFSTFVKKPVSWSLGAVVGSSRTAELDGEFVSPEVIKEKAGKVLALLQQRVQHTATDYVLLKSTVKSMAEPFCDDERSFDIILMLLVKWKKIILAETAKGEQVLKFAHPEEKSVGAITETELGVLRLQNTQLLLQSEISKLYDDINRSLEDARYYLSKGLRNSAKNALRRKKGVEKKVDQKECTLQVLTTLLEKIRDAESEKMILDAYEAGTAAMKQNVKDGLDLDRVEQTLDAVQEVLENQADITQVLSTSISDPALDVSDSDLLAELDELVTSNTDIENVTQRLSEFNIASLPDVPNTTLNTSNSQGGVLNFTFSVHGESPKGSELHKAAEAVLTLGD